MKNQKLTAWALASLMFLLGGYGQLASAETAAEKPAIVASTKLDNATCQTCHDKGKDKLEAVDAQGKKRTLQAIAGDKYGKSVHAKMTCISCHTEIVDSKSPHKINTQAKKPDCASCHEAEWNKVKNSSEAKKKPRMADVVDVTAEYKKSFHARQSKDDETKVMATCNQCHDVHVFDVPPKDTDARKKWRANDPKLCGTSCHEDQLEEYKESIHGVKVLDEGDTKAAVCTDCHTAHSVANTSTQSVKQAITESCGDCHEDQFKSYERTRHGKIASQSGGGTIRCTDCHGSHGVALLTKQPKVRTMVEQENKMCIACHDNDKTFAKFAPELLKNKVSKKQQRPDLDKLHSWLPNTKMHWKSVRCIDCHTSQDAAKSHEILDDKTAQRKCVACHTRDSYLAARLYRHLADEEQKKYGFANSMILADAYVIGATRHPLIDMIVLVLVALTLLGLIGHGVLRFIAARNRRENGK